MRRKTITIQEVFSSFALFEIPKEEVEAIVEAPSIQEKQGILEKLQHDAKTKWKGIAFKLHPDRNDGEDEKFKKVKGALDVILALSSMSFMPPRPPRIVHRIVYSQPMGYSGTSSTTTSTWTSTGSNGWF